MTSLCSQPKVELHLHLDCSLSYQVVSRLDPGISRVQYLDEFIAPPQCASLADFLTRAPRGFQLMQTEDALRLVVEDLFQQLLDDWVIYAEIRFAPLLHLLKGLTAEQVVSTVERAVDACVRATGVEVRIILCTLRHFTPAQSMATAALVERFQGSRVVALDIAGDEAGHGLEAHVEAFRHAREKGLRRTAHAGEARGAESVWQTLRELQPERIGHGVRSVEDAALVEHLRREQIHLEVCPSSNVQTRVCARYEEHPVEQLYRAGVALGVNTDARTITNVTLREEYDRLMFRLNWSDRDLAQCNRAALAAAFVDEATRARLRAVLDAG